MARLMYRVLWGPECRSSNPSFETMLHALATWGPKATLTIGVFIILEWNDHCDVVRRITMEDGDQPLMMFEGSLV